MPRARVRIAVAVKPGLLRRERRAKRISRGRFDFDRTMEITIPRVFDSYSYGLEKVKACASAAFTPERLRNAKLEKARELQGKSDASLFPYFVEESPIACSGARKRLFVVETKRVTVKF